jgi:CBS domain containing-hemolysin-like protein
VNPGAFVWAILLLIANGFFVAAEFAFTASRKEVIEKIGSRGAKAALGAMKELSETLAGAQVGITLATLLLGFVAEPSARAAARMDANFSEPPAFDRAGDRHPDRRVSPHGHR